MTLKTLSTLAFLFIFSFGFGQTLVKDFYEGFDGSQPSSLFAHGDYIYFTANHEIYGREIFRIHKETDEFQVVHEFFEGQNGLYRIDAFFSIGDIIYAFVASVEGNALYQLSVGSNINVRKINQLDGFFDSFSVVGERLFYFTIENSSEALHQLWYIDQMPNEATMLRTFPKEAHPSNLMEYKNQLFMILNNGIHGREIWKSDGNEVTLLGDVDVANGVSGLTKYKGNLYFNANDGRHGYELWRTDGTTQNTEMIEDVRSGSDGSFPSILTVSGDYLYFKLFTPLLGNELWRYDEESIKLVKDVNPEASKSSGIQSMIDVEGILYFEANVSLDGSNNHELWRSDGTLAGTYKVEEINPAGSGVFFSKKVNVDGSLYFIANDESNIKQLWKINELGKAVKIYGSSTEKPISAITDIIACGDHCFLSGRSGNNGQELWKIDNSISTSFQVTTLKESYPNGIGYMDAQIHEDKLYFIDSERRIWRTDGTEQGSKLITQPRTFYTYRRKGIESLENNFFFNTGDEFWKSDGTANGTMPVTGNATSPIEITYFKRTNSIIFSASYNRDGNQELWKIPSDGIRSSLLKDINPNGPSGPNSLHSTDDYILFFANDGIHGSELWRTDGTSSGTYLVKDINPGEDGKLIRDVEFTKLDDYYYFQGYNKEFGTELWRTDGTLEGTSMVKDINVGQYGGLFSRIVESDGILYFSGSKRRSNSELWRSDGTNDGTYKLKEVRPGNKGSEINAMLGLDRMLYFTASSENNVAELWKSDGTSEGTKLVKVLDRGFNADKPYRLIPLTENTFVFDLKHDNYGYEIWVSDGTTDGTYVLCDIHQGENSAYVNDYFVFKNKLYFTAEDGIHGREIWTIPFNICEDNSIEFDTLTQGGIYQATDQITLSNKTANRSSVIVKAGYEIVLEEGFETADNGWLTASIEECVNEEDAIVVEEREEEIEQSIEQPNLSCFPNPAHDLITIQYQLPNEQSVSVELYSVLGNRVKVLENATRMEGQHRIEVQTDQLEAGNYFVLLRAKDWMEVQQIVVVK